MFKRLSCVFILSLILCLVANQFSVADYSCETCLTWKTCTLYEIPEQRVLTDPRNGADAGCCQGGDSTPASGLNDNNNSGMICCWGMAPGPAAVNTVWFNKSAVPSKVKMWFQGNPGNCSDPRDFAVSLHMPGYPDNEGWVQIINVIDKPNNDNDMEWSKDSHFVGMLADGVRVHVTRSNEGVPGTGTGSWFSIAEMVVEGDLPTPTPTITPIPTATVPSGVSQQLYEAY